MPQCEGRLTIRGSRHAKRRFKNYATNNFLRGLSDKVQRGKAFGKWNLSELRQVRLFFVYRSHSKKIKGFQIVGKLSSHIRPL